MEDKEKLKKEIVDELNKKISHVVWAEGFSLKLEHFAYTYTGEKIMLDPIAVSEEIVPQNRTDMYETDKNLNFEMITRMGVKLIRFLRNEGWM